MKGRRVDVEAHVLQPGDYGQDRNGEWYAVTPTGLLATLRGHQVEAHEDGTITVSPSILVRQGRKGPSWHGYLERGVWRQE